MFSVLQFPTEISKLFFHASLYITGAIVFFFTTIAKHYLETGFVKLYFNLIYINYLIGCLWLLYDILG